MDSGSSCAASIENFAGCITNVILNPVMALLFVAGFLVFLWGIVEFMSGLSSGEGGEKVTNGKSHMLWGVVGMFVMVAAYAILKMVQASVDQLFR